MKRHRPQLTTKTKQNSFSMSKNLNFNKTTCLVHLILCGSSGWALKLTSTECSWAWGTFSLLLGHGMFGILRFGHPQTSETIRKIYDQTSLIAEVISLPLINIELYLHHNFEFYVAVIHFGMAAIPLLTQFYDRRKNERIVDTLVVGNVLSMAYVSIRFESVWAGGLATLVAINRFMFGLLADRYEVPEPELLAIGLSFFNIFAVNCVKEAKNLL